MQHASSLVLSPLNQTVISYVPPQSAPQPMRLIEPFLDDDSITDIMINRYDRIYIERHGRMIDTGLQFESKAMLQKLADEFLELCGRSADDVNEPIIDAMLPDGNRITIMLAPVAVEGPSISIRKFPKESLTLDRMVQEQLLDGRVSAFLKAAIHTRCNILVCGNTSSGKTTLLNALSAHISPQERIVTIEDTPELQIAQENVVRLEARADGTVTTGALVRGALRIRPDRIIMGEVRGAEAMDLLQAVNTGHHGSMATIHANSPRDAFARLEHMIALNAANMSITSVRQQIASAIDLIIHTQRDGEGQRRITHVTEVIGLEGDILVIQDLFSHQDEGRYAIANVTSRNAKIKQALLWAKTL